MPGLALKEVELPLGVAAALVGSDPSSSKIGTSSKDTDGINKSGAG